VCLAFLLFNCYCYFVALCILYYLLVAVLATSGNENAVHISSKVPKLDTSRKFVSLFVVLCNSNKSSATRKLVKIPPTTVAVVFIL